MFKNATIAVLAFSLPAFVIAADETTIKIGHVSAMSGSAAHLGRDCENGAIMAIEKLNADGVVIKGKKAKFVLVPEDDGGDPKQGTMVAQKLVDAKVSGVVGHLNSGTSIPASSVYAHAGIPEIAPSVTSMGYNSQGYKSTFRVVANDGKLGGALGRYAIEKLEAKTVAVIDDRTAFGQGVADEFIKGLKSANPAVKLSPRQYTKNDAVDFSSILTAIRPTKPDVIFFGGMDSTASSILRQMKTLGIKAKLMGGDGICHNQLAKLAGDAIGEGNVFCAVAGGVADEDKKGFNDFIDAYKKRFGIDVQSYAPYTYDAVMTMVEAMREANSADPAVYLPFLQKIHYKGVTGNISFDQKGNIQNGALTLYTFKNGHREMMGVIH